MFEVAEASVIASPAPVEEAMVSAHLGVVVPIPTRLLERIPGEPAPMLNVCAAVQVFAFPRLMPIVLAVEPL